MQRRGTNTAAGLTTSSIVSSTEEGKQKPLTPTPDMGKSVDLTDKADFDRGSKDDAC